MLLDPAVLNPGIMRGVCVCACVCVGVSVTVCVRESLPRLR